MPMNFDYTLIQAGNMGICITDEICMLLEGTMQCSDEYLPCWFHDMETFPALNHWPLGDLNQILEKWISC